MPEPRLRPNPVERLRGAVARWVVRLPEPVQLLLSGKRRVTIDGQGLDPSLQLLLALRPARQGLLEAGPVASRARLLREIISIRGDPTPIGRVTDLTVGGGDGNLPARLYLPERFQPGIPLMVFYHGGGFVLGGLDTHDEPCRLFAKYAESAVLSVDYRLAPEHPFPRPVEDAVAAFRWAFAHAAELGVDASRISVGGDSAGATLAAVVCLLTRADPVRPAAQLLIYPPTDHDTPRRSHRLFDRGFMLTMADREAFYAQYLRGVATGRSDWRISPLKAADLSWLPPAMVVTAGFDLLRDEAEAYAAALTTAGTLCIVQREPTLTHGFLNITGACPAAHQAVVNLALRWTGEVAPRAPME